MTKEEARIVWAAASEYRWRGFDHWWEKREGDEPFLKLLKLLDERLDIASDYRPSALLEDDEGKE